MKKVRCWLTSITCSLGFILSSYAHAQNCVDVDSPAAVSYASEFEEAWGLPSGAIATVREIVRRLSRTAGLHPSVSICYSEQVNAQVYCKSLAKCEVRLHSYLVANLSRDPDALAFVVAHEYGHALLNHTNLTAEVSRALWYEWYEAALAGSGGSAGKYLALVFNRFGREKERDSDDVGHVLLVKAGFHPSGARRTFDLFAMHGRDAILASYNSRHPGISERAINSAFRELNEDYRDRAYVNLLRYDERELKRTVERWEKVIPPSGARHFYQALLQLKSSEPWSVALDSFDEAHAHYLGEGLIIPGGSLRANPTADVNVVVTSGLGALAQLGQWEGKLTGVALCVALFHDERHAEALDCVSTLGSDDVARFREVTGWNAFLIMSNKARQPAAANPLYGGEKDGVAIVTDSPFLALDEGLKESRPRTRQRAPRRLLEPDFSKVKWLSDTK